MLCPIAVDPRMHKSHVRPSSALSHRLRLSPRESLVTRHHAHFLDRQPSQETWGGSHCAVRRASYCRHALLLCSRSLLRSLALSEQLLFCSSPPREAGGPVLGKRGTDLVTTGERAVSRRGLFGGMAGWGKKRR